MNECPFCGGEGKTPLPISPIYLGSVNVTELKTRTRVRIEITSLMVNNFLDKFINKEKVCLFVLSQDKIEECMTPEKLGEIADRFSQNSKGERE